MFRLAAAAFTSLAVALADVVQWPAAARLVTAWPLSGAPDFCCGGRRLEYPQPRPCPRKARWLNARKPEYG